MRPMVTPAGLGLFTIQNQLFPQFTIIRYPKELFGHASFQALHPNGDWPSLHFVGHFHFGRLRQTDLAKTRVKINKHNGMGGLLKPTVKEVDNHWAVDNIRLLGEGIELTTFFYWFALQHHHHP